MAEEQERGGQDKVERIVISDPNMLKPAREYKKEYVERNADGTKEMVIPFHGFSGIDRKAVEDACKMPDPPANIPAREPGGKHVVDEKGKTLMLPNPDDPAYQAEIEELGFRRMVMAIDACVEWKGGIPGSNIKEKMLWCKERFPGTTMKLYEWVTTTAGDMGTFTAFF